jgi:cytochrome c oxidase subunit IV
MVSYEEGLVAVRKGLLLLGAITIVEVFIALLGNGHIIEGFHLPKIVMYPIMIGFSIYKAYYIIFNFMHMAYEVRGLAMSVLMPMLLLVWGLIAFFSEGSSWNDRRQLIKRKNERIITQPTGTTGEVFAADTAVGLLG